MYHTNPSICKMFETMANKLNLKLTIVIIIDHCCYTLHIFCTDTVELQGLSPSDHEDENDPDGPYAFKRRKNCSYYTVSIMMSLKCHTKIYRL